MRVGHRLDPQFPVFVLGEGAGQAAGLLFGLGALGGIGFLVSGDVANAQAATGPQDPECLGEHARFVGGQVDDAVGDDDVDVATGQRDVL